MKHFVRYIILFLMIATVTGCYDEFMKEEIIGEGKASISATLDFKPMSSALSRTRAAGDALKDISSLHVLLYECYVFYFLLHRYIVVVHKFHYSFSNKLLLHILGLDHLF